MINPFCISIFHECVFKQDPWGDATLPIFPIKDAELVGLPSLINTELVADPIKVFYFFEWYSSYIRGPNLNLAGLE